MNHESTFGFIGGGRVTYFLLKALSDKNALPEKIIVSDPNEAARAKIQAIATERIQAVNDNKLAAQEDVVFLAVHPPVIKDVIEAIKVGLKPQAMLISLAPVFKIEKLSALLGGFNRIVRMIPNAPSIIHHGYNPVVFGSGVTADEKSWLMNMFSNWGQSPEVAEQKLEAYAIVTAMGPTYFWPQWAKLEALGKSFGLNDAELKSGMAAMLTGAVALMYQSDLSPQQVMDLIPVYPMKDHEAKISELFEAALVPLYQKLSGAAR
ncbi:MAG: NAD(P)-binding domain-containing protein [candidate division KSB1 bacterium]|nr:NAD(P)-binding domain-containing protein [candidate division KSB1 bacterium]